MATLYLADDDESIRKKLMKAVTGEAPAEKNSVMPDSVANLFLLMELVSTQEVIAQYKNDYSDCRIRFGDMKKQLAEDMVKFIAPIRQKANSILADENYLEKIMRQGADKARKSANASMELVRQAMGLKYF